MTSRSIEVPVAISPTEFVDQQIAMARVAIGRIDDLLEVARKPQTGNWQIDSAFSLPSMRVEMTNPLTSPLLQEAIRITANKEAEVIHRLTQARLWLIDSLTEYEDMARKLTPQRAEAHA